MEEMENADLTLQPVQEVPETETEAEWAVEKAPLPKPKKKRKGFLRFLSYVLVAALASVITLGLAQSRVLYVPIPTQGGKLAEVQQVIDAYFIGDADKSYMEDMAADAMVTATGDRWSYYIPASQMQAYEEQKANAYVGIGVTIMVLEDQSGFEVQKVEPGSPAKEGGILPGDVIVAVEGQRVSDIGPDAATNMVKGQEGTQVDITISRDGQEQVLTLTRKRILTQVVSGYMITDTIGYIKINNFDDRCSDETIALFEQLEAQGAKAFIFDVRFNPGGYKHELVALLDYLLPKGVLFRSEDYRGVTSEDKSNASCKEYPMAVLVNADSYSAAEFFAAALVEYEYAFTVGQDTTGKGYFQTTIPLSDGSAVNLSIGKYYTPNGVSLAEVGGIRVDVPVEIDEETAALLYGEMLPAEEDMQLQSAVAELEKRIGE